MSDTQVFVEKCPIYNGLDLDRILAKWAPLFAQNIMPGQSVIIKPNWISHAHKYNENEWDSIITHPAVITAVLKAVLKQLRGSGRVTITDGPQTQSSWEKLMGRMTPDKWIAMGKEQGVDVSILDLREDAWVTKGDVIVSRRKLAGDPLGSTICDLADASEFVCHRPSKKGYFGADYDSAETNEAHSRGRHMYRVSRTITSTDVFINIPKMKTHKKAGITCSLKNLVGINTYKNWLPHHSEGTPEAGGDQFPGGGLKNKFESLLLTQFTSVLSSHHSLGRWLVPVKGLGRAIFGDTRDVIRSGNWYGNDTIWRMILDLNKLLFYVNPDGTLRNETFGSRKPYISVVDGIISGEKNGPEAPDGKNTGLLIAGTNPVAVDAVCAKLMGFDWRKIPAIQKSFSISRYSICDFDYEDVSIESDFPGYNGSISDLSYEESFCFEPHFGWKNHIELSQFSR